MKCNACQSDFVLQPNKPGYANICPNCTTARPPKEPEKLMATVAWSGKHTCEINVTTPAKARAFNAANSRRGYGAGLRFTPAAEPFSEKDRDASVIGTEYRTSLGEARKIK